MGFKNDLQRVIWHELGHCCIDSIIVENFEEYNIQEFGLSYHPNAVLPFTWRGWIKISPEPKGLGETMELTAFYLIGLISGCLFQQAYYNKIVGNLSDALIFERCFIFTGPGNQDLYHFNSVNRLFRNRYGRNEECIKFIEGDDLINLYREFLFNEDEFINLINILSLKCCELVIEDYNSLEEKKDYTYKFNDDFLIELRNDISDTMKKTKFYNFIIDLKKLMIDKMTY